MRFALLATLTLALSAIAVPPADAAGAPFMDDPAGDTAYDLFVTGVPVTNPEFDNADLLSLGLVEDVDAFTFTIGVKKVETTASSAYYRVAWTFKDTEFTVYLYHQLIPSVQDYWGGGLQSYSEDEGWNYIADLEPAIDTTANTIMVVVPKAYVLDSRNRMPATGDKLEDMFVQARSYATVFQISSQVEDRMPDSDVESFGVNVGDLAEGTLRLTADDRLRVSNGGSTTFVFRALLQNKGEFDQRVDLSLADLPEGWNGTLQSPVQVPAKGERTVTALVSVPFAHDHGGFSSFNLTAVSKSDPASRATVRMGVLHTPIPQPAGHHSELYLHAVNENSGIFATTFPWTPGTINTNSDHAADAPEAIADGWGRDGGSRWTLELDPVLRMGLDFDLERVGEIAGTMIPRQTGEGKITAKLILYRAQQSSESDGSESGDSETVVLAESDEATIAMDMNGEVPFKLTLTPTEEADYIAYEKGQSMALHLFLDGSVGNIAITNQQGPSLKVADFKATLPLNEYHDRLTGFADAAEALELKAEGVVEKAGRPGATLTYAFKLVNTEDRETVVNLDVAGGNAELGTLVPGDQITLGPKETRDLTLAVAIPPEAASNQEYEVLIFAHARDDPTKVAIARTKTTAVTGSLAAERATEDESEILAAAQAREEKDTPASGALLAIAGLAIALLAASRRRR